MTTTRYFIKLKNKMLANFSKLNFFHEATLNSIHSLAIISSRLRAAKTKSKYGF